MKKRALLVALVAGSILSVRAQLDTIYTTGQRIACTVVEVGSDAVKFTYPQEEAQNTLYINAIQKVVFRSGRVQEFSQGSSFRALSAPDDWEKVTLCSVESEVRGLYKLGEVSSKATGTTELANVERVKQRAIRKAKMSTALLGGNVIYVLNLRDQGSTAAVSVFGSYGSTSPQVSITGVGYTNQPIAEGAVRSWFASHSGELQASATYTLLNTDSEMHFVPSRLPFNFDGIQMAGATVMVEGSLRGVRAKQFSVSYVSPEAIYLYCTDKSGIYVYKITR